MNYYQTLSTLRFATRAKCVRIQVTTNEYLDDKDKIYYYQKEIKKLKEQLRNRENKINYNISNNNNLNYNEEPFGAVSQYEYNKILNAFQNLNEELENYKILYKKEKEKSERYKAQINGNSYYRIEEENENVEEEEEEDNEEKNIINNNKNNMIKKTNFNNKNNNNKIGSDFKSYENFKLLKKEKLNINNGGIKNNNNLFLKNNDKDEYEQLKKYIRYNTKINHKDNLSLKRINSYDNFKKVKRDKVPLKTDRDEKQNLNDHSQLISNNYYLTEQDTKNTESNYINNKNKEYGYIKTNNQKINGNNVINDNDNDNYYDKDEETINAIKNGNVFNMLDINYHEIMYNNKTPKQFDILKKLYDFKMDALEKTMDYYQSFLDEYYKKKINEIDSIKGLTEIVQNKKRIMIANITDEYKNNLNKLRNLYKEKKEELEYKFSMYMKNLSS
jgi:hypothetical protein